MTDCPYPFRYLMPEKGTPLRAEPPRIGEYARIGNTPGTHLPLKRYLRMILRKLSPFSTKLTVRCPAVVAQFYLLFFTYGNVIYG